MTDIKVRQRGKDLPLGVTDQDGLPSVKAADLAANAWLLWRAALSQAQAPGAKSRPHKRNGNDGVLWFANMKRVENMVWPAMTGRQGDELWTRSNNVSVALRSYLRETGNMLFADSRRQAHGKLGGNWWIALQWSDWRDTAGRTPDARDHGESKVTPAQAGENLPPGAVEQSWGCRSCKLRFTSGEALKAHRDAEHPPEVQYELRGGPYLLADVLTCMGDTEKISSADLATLMSAGHPDYEGLSAITLGKALRQRRVPVRQQWFGPGNAVVGVVRAEVALTHENDVALQVAREAADAVAEAQKVIALRQRATDPADALRSILDENVALKASNAELLARLDSRDREPVDQALIDRALDKVRTEMQAEIDKRQEQIETLTAKLAAARRVLRR